MPSPNRSWLTKFRNAFRGLWVGVARQNSFIVHLLAALAALVAALLLGVTPGKWCVLVIAITVVLVAELFNTALEHMAQ
ncbi:MAG: diacylglycerol kinase, partial [Pirellulales bacterium]|nr:diacylglycerol kinase [Pirellulales bacterium]